MFDTKCIYARLFWLVLCETEECNEVEFTTSNRNLLTATQLYWGGAYPTEPSKELLMRIRATPNQIDWANSLSQMDSDELDHIYNVWHEEKPTNKDFERWLYDYHNLTDIPF